jgi:hypothetical protein
MAKNQHTFAKRQRELEKKRKADEKRLRRQKRKDGVDTDESTAETGVADSDTPDTGPRPPE